MSMTYYAVTDDPNELAHYGILGMKWGVVHDKPRHSGSRRPRSAAYKKAQSKLGKMMRSGIKKAEAQWKAYNSPKAKEARFMKKAMQQARTGTLKYGKLTDDQVRRVTERLALERNARQLGSTENPKFMKRLKTAIGTGVITGIGQGTASYINERFKGRGAVDAEIKRDKRMSKYESDQRVQQRKAQNKINQEYYEEAERRGYKGPLYESQENRAKQLMAWKDRDAKEAERTRRQNAYYETYYRTAAANRAKSRIPDKTSGSSSSSGSSSDSGSSGGGSSKPSTSPVTINVYSPTGRVTTRPLTRSTGVIPSGSKRRPRKTGRGRH